MKLRYQLLTALFVVGLAGGLVWVALHYHGKYMDEQQRANVAESNLNLANSTITDMQVRQRNVATLDAKYTGELADAKATIEQLQRDVADGSKRLHIAATCKPVSSSARTAGMDDAASPGLTDAAERDYFTLRERIGTSGKMIAGLQAYIREQCMIGR